ncbi:dihydrolipoyl dehydrogenase [Dethiosulfatarculus sandiegensis]|uniref:Dihydrolipoyl dehydrogenase n=1 Tax=Dethiosulfatarculus sandiegensis TaxID=1429043 RepID=A0A0D2G854_9BACT|nr:dihydrolipoyl dehydrogenase [Dethiosulfatarculus sandiegensis]KIX11127.1 dihydrolipoamide dehydrogenase [Dethiosulfatarculus sandiegensis]
MFDVMVIGGGPGGYAAAIRASQLGGKVALIEQDRLGGTCVHKGCIPSKVWLHTAGLMKQIKEAKAFGLDLEPPRPDLAAVKARKDGVGNDIAMGMAGLLSNNQVEFMQGRAKFIGAGQAEVDGREVKAKAVILAMGSSLDIPDLPGLEDVVITSDQVMDMDEVPESVLIFGQVGPIEAELACLLNGFGCKVTVAAEQGRILPNEEADTSQRLTQGLRDQGVDFLPRHTLESLESNKDGCVACLKGPKEEVRVEVQRVLSAFRRPNSQGLEEVGVDLGPGKEVLVDEYLQTSLQGVYAIGDLTGGTMLSHASSFMAIPAAENAMGRKTKFNPRLVPRVLWTIPQVAAVGLSEDQAEDQGYDVEIGEFPYSINGLAMSLNQMAGSVRIVADSKYGEILGMHIVGAGATENIGEGVLAMQLECTANELARGLRPHPTFSETVVDAARDVGGWALYLPRG